MSLLGDVLAAIDDFRADLLTAQQSLPTTITAATADLGIRGMMGQRIHPLQNVHATGVGIRRKKGQLVEDDFVIKVYVFDKREGLPTAELGILATPFHGIEIDIAELPVMQAQAKAPKGTAATTPRQHQSRKRPIVGGLQIQPRGAGFVGTLGCFVRSAVPGSNAVYALSNNHVLADTNELPLGTEVVQSASNDSNDVFARLSDFERIHLPSRANPTPVRNRLDAAIAAVTDESLIKLKSIFGISRYTPKLKAPLPSMKVTKSGRTTAVTKGTVDAIRVNGVRVNYGTLAAPIIGVFDGTVQIVGDNGRMFSDSGDSGSAILETETGQPVALLFAGDDDSTTACDMTAVCTRFNVVPV